MDDVLSALEAHGIALQPDAIPMSVGGKASAWRIETTAEPLFVKLGGLDSYRMFQAEALGLQTLAKANAVRVPAVIACLRTDLHALIAIEWLELRSPTEKSDAQLGRRLARLHRVDADRFGWDIDNTIGPTPQINTWSDDWPVFFTECRLKFQLDLVKKSRIDNSLAEDGYHLLESIGPLLEQHRPAPSLLHGDLWSGNRACVDGEPAIFDPATHFGDRECDIAMTRLFGGFNASFYSAYQKAWPLPAGHERRVAVYQLYHVLNHVNLFGGGYVRQARELMRTIDENV